ncbi:MAG: glycosyltransferase [Bacteroidales bacterium]|nr:glycosyltransferase [Bacteroidales bacterium]
MKRLSIIIVTYNSENDIFDCLDSVWKNNDLAADELEVIVVDNSSDSTSLFAAIRERYGEQVKLIHNTHNGGYGQGNNVGIREASAPVVAVMNPDVRLFEPIFKSAVRSFDTDPELVMLGLKQMHSPTKTSSKSFCGTFMMNGYAQVLLTGLCNRFDWYLSRWMYIQGSFFFVHRQKFMEIGMFDETNFMYGEEDDIHCRLGRRFGYGNIRYNSSLHYIHPLHVAKDRSLDYEKTKILAAVKLNEKNGYSRRDTILNRLRNIRFLIFMQRVKGLLGKSDPSRMEVMLQLRNYLQEFERS